LLFFIIGVSALENEYGFLKESGSVNAKSMGMGGAHTTSGWDFEAIHKNPAALTQIRSKELHLTYSYTSLRDSAYNTKLGMSGVDGTTELKIKSLGYVYSFPTIRGSLVAAFGYSRPQDMADIRLLAGSDKYDKVQSDGHMGQWSAAIGVDVAEKLGLGLSVSYKTGFEDYTKTSQFSKYAQKDSYSGVLVNGGWLYRMPSNLYMGGSIQFFDLVNLHSEATKDSANELSVYSDGNGVFILPVKIKIGLSYVTTPLTVSIEAGYSTWSETDYEFKGEDVANHSDEFLDISTFNAGVEWLLPFVPVKVRTGIGYAPSNRNGEIKDNPFNFGGGFGVIIDRSFVIDVAAELSSSDYKYASTAGSIINEKRVLRTGLITLSYRY
jgi:hypothetical protein